MVLDGISLYNISISYFYMQIFFIISWILMRKPHLKGPVPPILTPPSKSWTTSVTNKQTIFLNFDICKSFVLRYLVSDEDMGKNHNPKDW